MAEFTQPHEDANTPVRDIRIAMIVWGYHQKLSVFRTVHIIRKHLEMKFTIVLDRQGHPCVHGIKLIPDY